MVWLGGPIAGKPDSYKAHSVAFVGVRLAGDEASENACLLDQPQLGNYCHSPLR